MFGSNNSVPQGAGPQKGSVQSGFDFLASIVASIAALLASGAISDLTWDWAVAFFQNAWGSRELGLVGAFGFVTLSTVCVWQICRITLLYAVSIAATSMFIRSIA